MRTIALSGPVDLAGFRQAARGLLTAAVPPGQVSWQSSTEASQDLFSFDEAIQVESSAPASETAPAVRVPPEFASLCTSVILHSDPNRFGLLYRLLWRLKTEPSLRQDPLDADWLQAQRMAQAVRRDMHKMKAFVRFREVVEPDGVGEPLHIAWFEPDHHTLQATAPFFVRRFTQMRWAILTPECSASWDCEALTFGPGAKKQDTPPADAGEALWLTYYQNIFNPARLKLKMMQKEMPKRYWKNLPEAQFITELAAGAAERRSRMVNAVPSVPKRRIPAHSRLTRSDH
jgi:uracil-DNA glycosylase